MATVPGIVDWTNPCDRATALRSAYYALISGNLEQRVRFRNGDTEEEVTFSQTKIDVLATELKNAEALCAALTSGRPARRAITAG